ncbi:MAG: Asp-tRNA(Asn)/Glu-tRNA(Gln) amidotransferase subunit GatC [Candidatus Buchananbacteria bacterium]|nr:Asp-tRNA(Asn)/Glu-tRNA(Gln) amidotransferase subunit GatC [Candidatus Buchananbacteria bacterium]
MKLTIQEVEKIANLARLGLTDAEKEKFANQLSSILDYFEQLKEVDTTNVEPVAQITGLESVMREDEIKNCEPEVMKELIDQAPESQDNLVKTRAVFE